MREPSLRQLRALIEVARASGIGRAAQALHLTQPAVSMQIRDLESAVGLPLFERVGKGMRLTTTGEYLLVYARRIFAALKEAEDTIARLRGLKGGRVVIGMVSTADHFLPRLLARFRSEHTGVEILLQLGNREQLVQALLGNEVDLAVMGRPPEALAARAEPFAAHPLGVVASPTHPLARSRNFAPSSLAQEAFIVREPGSGTRAAMEHFFQEHRIAPPLSMQMSSNETIKQAVLADMGLAFLSLHTVAQELTAGSLRVLDIQGLPVMRRWHLVHLPARPLAPAAEAFRYFVLAEGERLIAELFGKAVPARAAA
ncbi:MAG TPA: LysR substrate-binding domain-containing protein [Verrucomicrobiae bacterium]|nr:LysR substrate-binding domain-containing protein [Verrucomicrobiae bacterium]